MFSIQNKAKEKIVEWSFLSPALIYIIVLFVFPFLFSLGITFTNMRLLSPEINFVGLANWERLIADKNAFLVMKNTVVIAVLGSLLQYLIGLLLAILLNNEFKGYKFFRVSFLLPMMMAPVAISYVIGKMIFSETFGPLNDILFRLDLPLFLWGTSSIKSMLLIMIIDAWTNIPFFILVLLASLEAIPTDIYEAATVDGASGWQRFRKITLPLLIPVSITTITIRALNAFQIIDVIRVVTGGGPGNSTESATLFAYDLGIKGQDIAYAATVSFLLLIIILIFIFLIRFIGNRISPSFE
jgi:multiple sugar transport system permease protein